MTELPDHELLARFALRRGKKASRMLVDGRLRVVREGERKDGGLLSINRHARKEMRLLRAFLPLSPRSAEAMERIPAARAAKQITDVHWNDHRMDASRRQAVSGELLKNNREDKARMEGLPGEAQRRPSKNQDSRQAFFFPGSPSRISPILKSNHEN